jgi:hypothetical protein
MDQRCRQLIALVALAFPSVARAQDAGPPGDVDAAPPELTPEEQAELEKALAADAAALAQSKPAEAATTGGAIFQTLNPDISFITDVALAWFSDDEPMQGGGHDPSKNGFTLQQLEMAIGKSVDPYFRFDSNVVFSQFGVEVEEAYATSLAFPWNLQLRAGQFLTRFGRLNSTHPHAWDFVDQPFALSRVFGGEGNRGLGAELSYLTPLPWYVEIVGSVTDAAGEATARSFFGGEDLGVSTPLDFQFTLAVKQFFDLSANGSLFFGLSMATGPNPTGHDNRSEVYGTDLYLKYRPITYGSYTIVALQTEWFYRRRQIPNDVLQDVSGYAYLFWRFARRWGTALRYEYGGPALNIDGARSPDDYLDPFWTDHRQRVSANVTFWPTEFSRVRFQASVDHAGWREDPIFAAFMTLEFSVGAHGAHKF